MFYKHCINLLTGMPLGCTYLKANVIWSWPLFPHLFWQKKDENELKARVCLNELLDPNTRSMLQKGYSRTSKYITVEKTYFKTSCQFLNSDSLVSTSLLSKQLDLFAIEIKKKLNFLGLESSFEFERHLLYHFSSHLTLLKSLVHFLSRTTCSMHKSQTPVKETRQTNHGLYFHHYEGIFWSNLHYNTFWWFHQEHALRQKTQKIFLKPFLSNVVASTFIYVPERWIIEIIVYGFRVLLFTLTISLAVWFCSLNMKR